MVLLMMCLPLFHIFITPQLHGSLESTKNEKNSILLSAYRHILIRAREGTSSIDGIDLWRESSH